MLLDELNPPLVLAPLAGGPATVELAVAVSDAGALGFIAAGYLSAEETGQRIHAFRAASSRPFGVNVFVPGSGPTDPERYAEFAAPLRHWASDRELAPGEPRFGEDEWHEKIELLLADPVPVVSFVFGCPDAATLSAVRASGAETWVTVTSVQEAQLAAAAGADALIVQGAEAGGHRGSFVDRPDLPSLGLLPLLQEIRAASLDLPLIAAGGIQTGAALAAALAAGARAAQLGTAFLLAPESGAGDAYRAAIAGDAPTAQTRSFTGRLARGIRNRFMDELADAPVAFPEIHHMTAPLRASAREHGDADGFNLWAGEAHALAYARPAAETVAAVASELDEAIARLSGRGGRARPRGSAVDESAAPREAPGAFERHAADYNDARARLIPPFEAFYGTAAAAVALAGEVRAVLDLGAGTGILAAHVAAAHPSARLTLLDAAPSMLAQARSLLGDSHSYVEGDLRDRELPAGPWDAVVSALAIHHLSDEEKRRLFARIGAALRPGGVFVNAEQIAGPSPRYDALYAEWHEQRARGAGSSDAEWAGAVERMSHDRTATVVDQLRWLAEVAFDADCLFKDHRFAVIVACRRGG